MPYSKYPKRELKLSFADVFKSSRTLREEAEAAALKRALLEARLKEVEQVARALPPLKDSTPTAQSTDPKPANPTPVPAVTKPAASSGTPFYQWTAEQDLMLMKLKAENMSWRAISTGLGKPVYVLKDRWAIIQPKIRAPKEASKVQKENEPASNPEGNNKHQHRVSFSEPLVTPVNTDGAVDPNQGKKEVLYLDEAFTLDDIILLNQIAAKYEAEKWLRISSRFFDKTGKRHSPQILKKHVREKQMCYTGSKQNRVSRIDAGKC